MKSISLSSVRSGDSFFEASNELLLGTPGMAEPPREEVYEKDRKTLSILADLLHVLQELETTWVALLPG